MNINERIALLYDNNHVTDLYSKLDTWARLRRYEKKYQRLQEYQCNGGTYMGIDFNDVNYDDEYNPVAVAEFRIETKISALVKLMNPEWQVKFQGDPRGYTVQIYHNMNYISQLVFG
ncbi:MAG TPA: hypothetical protein PL124_08585 [Candidatus Cloacimonadota bacterium]|nr:hypothetical protein [Candidatus Cloacimonadota bacterium]